MTSSLETGGAETDLYRIGVGAGFAGDRLEPAIELVQRGNLDALVFECLAERTIALAQCNRVLGTSPGYDPRILKRFEQVLPAAAEFGTAVITNGGAADPRGAASAVIQLLERLGLQDRLTVAAVTGDDVLDQLDFDAEVLETGEPLSRYADRIISANAYLGAEGIVEALERGANVVITGRVGDPSLFAAPLMHAHGKQSSDHEFVSRALMLGHLLECGGQLTGGYFADGQSKLVPGLARLGFPFADVDPTGHALLGKLAGTGGVLNRQTVLEQLYYEVQDPHCYITPDLSVDFSDVRVRDLGQDRVEVSGVRPVTVPTHFKVSVGVNDGQQAYAEISYAGSGCELRARMAAEIVLERWRDVHGFDPAAVRVDMIGVNSMRPWWQPSTDAAEVRLRLSVVALDPEIPAALCSEVEALYTNGPAGGGGVSASMRASVGIVSVLLPRDNVKAAVWI